jgi:REP element-mobilizing transposase RayT
MARKIRIEYPGAIYHVMNRGDRREPIFQDDFDRRRFLETLGEACAKTDWLVHAWCLMSNHFHLVVETPQPNLVAGMKWFLGTYTSRFNRRHRLSGHLFSGRYKALVVDGSGNGYLRTVCDYVHLNPVRAKLLTPEQPLRAYVWSSYLDYLRKPAQRLAWIRVGRLLGEMGIPQDSGAGRQQFEQRMEQRRSEKLGAEWKAIRRGWCLGEDAFRQELLARLDGQMGEHHYGMERRESAEDKAVRIVREELARAGWTEEDLGLRAKGDPVKVAVAIRLRAETTMTLKWISQRLRMGAWTHLNKRLYEQRLAKTKGTSQ